MYLKKLKYVKSARYSVYQGMNTQDINTFYSLFLQSLKKKQHHPPLRSVAYIWLQAINPSHHVLKQMFFTSLNLRLSKDHPLQNIH